MSVNDALAVIYGSTPDELLALPSYLDPLADEDRRRPTSGRSRACGAIRP